MDPEISHCLVHMVLVQNAVQCLLNAAAFLLGPLKWHYLPPFAPIGLLTTVFSIYTISKPRFRLIIWYMIFLLIGFLYRIYVIVDMCSYRSQLQKIIRNCDDYDLIDIDANHECDSTLDFKIISLNLINSITCHFVALVLDIFLIIVSFKLRSAWKCLDEHRLLLLTVQYDKNSKVIGKFLKDKYGTFRVLAEDGRLNDEIDFIKGNLLKANYFESLESSYETSFERSSRSELYKTAEFGEEVDPPPTPMIVRRPKDIYENLTNNHEDSTCKPVQTNEKVNDQIMANIKNVFSKFLDSDQISNVLQLITIILLFAANCLSVPTTTVASTFDSLKASKLLNTLIDDSNAIDVPAKILNSTDVHLTSSNDHQSKQSTHNEQSNSSIKKQIDESIDEQQLSKLNALDASTAKVCNATTEYRCKASGDCIDKSLLCDGFKDCLPHGDDEMNCNGNCAEQNKFQCKSDGKCIDMIFKCNSFPDCKDGSDEEDCGDNAIFGECSKDEFGCSSGECIHKNKVCDRTNDCSDGSDELICKYTCADNEFQCKKDNKCIPLSLKCNNQNECSDGSDEEDCAHLYSNYTCAANEFSCEMEPHKCVPLEKVCDDIDDCGNNADEPPECTMDLCKDHHCAHSCEQVRNTVKCTCRPGYKLSANGVDCEDVNECVEMPGFCSGHHCVNLDGSATCNCGEGYRYNANENRCKVINGRNATIVYSNQNELRNTSLSIKSYLPTQLQQNTNEPNGHNEVIRQNLNAIGMFVYDFADNYIVWHDMNERRFYIASLDEQKRPVERNEFWTHFKLPTPHHHRLPRTPLNKNQHYLLMENVTNVEGMALDYVHDLIYWTDTDRNVIEVAEVRNPLKRKVLIDTDLDEPKGIVVDVKRSFLLFTDWGYKPRIEYINQDGTGRRTVFDKNLEWPYSIALDSYLDKVYWVDTKKNTLNVVDLSGENHQVLLTNTMYLERANDLDVFEDKVYWSDQESESILSVDKFKPKTTISVLVKDLKNVLSSKIVHFSKQPVQENLCAQSDCEFMCLPRNDLKSHTCACPNSRLLNADHRSCAEAVVEKSSPATKTVTTEALEDASIFYKIFGSPEPHRSNTVVIYLLALAVFLVLMVAVICFYLAINFAKKKANKLKFNNAQYQKTPQQDTKPLPYLEPLNQPVTNDFV